MKCENLQLNLSTYLDDCLTAGERGEIETHLPQCPLCRQKLADFQSVRNDLRGLSRPGISANALSSIRNRIALETRVSKAEHDFLETFIRGETSSHWWKMHLMPYSVGTALSLAFGLTLLWSLLSAAGDSNTNAEIARLESIEKSAVLLAKSDSGMRSSEPNTPDFSKFPAATDTSRESPSINPKGALAAVAKSLVRGKIKDAEVVVVADVYGSGLAEIAQVVEPSSDGGRTVRELEKALRSDSEYAPFMSAKFDNREDKTLRVVLKIQRVDVDTQ